MTATQVQEIPMKQLLLVTVVVAAAGVLAACSQTEAKPEVIRPVRTVTVASGDNNALSFAGEVKPRHETRLAFRVPGQMVERRVEVGAIVKAGQVLATLDRRDLQLSQSAARAQWAQAESQMLLAEADFKRYAELRRKNFISQAEFERREAQFTQSREAAAAARAASQQSANQAAYGTLVAPHAGVITAIEAESGQVISAGQTIARLARLEEKEVAFSVPEHMLDAAKHAERFQIRLWSKPDAVYTARLRELAPVADSASRTYAARLTVANADADLAFGMTAEVRVHASTVQTIKVPMTALIQEQDRSSVWVVDGEPLAVRRVAVTTGAVNADAVQIVEGLKPGEVVVTAGVNLLAEGQKVRLLDQTQVATGTQP